MYKLNGQDAVTSTALVLHSCNVAVVQVGTCKINVLCWALTGVYSAKMGGVVACLKISTSAELSACIQWYGTRKVREIINYMARQPEVEKMEAVDAGQVTGFCCLLKHFQAPIGRELVRRMTFKGVVTINVSIIYKF